MSLLRSLDNLAGTPPPLPQLCNLYCEIEGRPFEKPDFGGRWHVPVRSLSGRSRALLAIHRDPARSPISLSYKHTLGELLNILDDPKLRALLQPGELVLVQGMPCWGAEQVLYLNVPAVLVLRPFQAFGRRLIDFQSSCPRKTFLVVTKGVGRSRGGSGGGHWGSVGGKIAHQVVERLAVDGCCDASDDAVLLDALQGDTLVETICLGLATSSDMIGAVNKGRDAARTVREDNRIRELLSRGGWRVESDALNNGVSLSPDLLGQSDVVEIKHVSPDSPGYGSAQSVRQVEAYLAWAMVEHGVDEVCQSWTGHLVNVHGRVPVDQRIHTLKPIPEMLGQRLRNRHKLLGLAVGRWLPEPREDECEFCEFAFSPDGAPELPAACTYYCQAERHWNCVDQNRACPLLGHCDQHDRFDAYERLDLFNNLRRDLVEEEEEQDALTTIIETLAEGESGSRAGWVVSDLSVASSERGMVRLELPEALRALSFAVPGQEFTVLRASVPIGSVRFRKRKGDVLVFRTGLRGSLSLEPGEKIALRRLVGGRFQVREQLEYLDKLQRQGEEPISLRAGRARQRPLALRQWSAIDQIPVDSRFVLIDAPGRRRSIEVTLQLIRTFLARDARRVLVLGGESFESELGKDAITLSADVLGEAVDGALGTISDRLKDVVAQVQSRRVWIVGRDELYKGRLDAWASAPSPPFGLVVLPGADTLPLLALQRCMPLTDGTIALVGHSIAAGPRVESPRARQSLLFQNTLRFLLEAGTHALPESLGVVDTVRLPIERAVDGLERLPGIGIATGAIVGVRVHEVSRSTRAKTPGAGLTLRCEVGLSPGQQQVRIVEMELATEGLPIRRIRELLRGLRSASIENLSPTVQGQLDTSVLGYAARVLRIATRNEEGNHELLLNIPYGNLRFIQEHGLASEDEALALVERAADIGPSCVASSPFTAQSLLIARIAAEKRVALRVATPDELGVKPQLGQPTLLLSLVADRADPSFPFPLSDIATVAPMLIGDYKDIEIFCSPEVAEHHPLLRLLRHAR